MKKNRYCTLKIFIKKDIPSAKVISHVNKLYNSIWEVYHDKKNEEENPSEDEKIVISSLHWRGGLSIFSYFFY